MLKCGLNEYSNNHVIAQFRVINKHISSKIARDTRAYVETHLDVKVQALRPHREEKG